VNFVLGAMRNIFLNGNKSYLQQKNQIDIFVYALCCQLEIESNLFENAVRSLGIGRNAELYFRKDGSQVLFDS
jgi:negative regulator of replication initiation